MGQRRQVGYSADLHRRVSRFGRWSWLASLALTGGLVTACGSGGDGATTRLTKVADGQIVTAAGRTVAARPGMTLHRGDEVRTGAGGAAVMTTGDRTSYLGAQGSYVVSGRSSGILRRGAFVVDDRKGPALTVTSGPITARVTKSAVRVEHGFAVRIGVLAGRAVMVTGDGSNGPARLRLAPLYQTVVAGRGLVAASPLALVDDDAERLVAPDLVADDVQLTHTATALDSGAEGRLIVTVAVADGITTTGPRHDISETALPMAIARAVTPRQTDRAALRAHYTEASTLRAAGGSWGVVARLAGTDATATGRAIDALLANSPNVGTVLAVAPIGPAGGGTAGTTSSPRPRRSSNGNQSTGNGGRNDNGNGSGSQPTTSPTPSPSPSPAPVQQVIDGVLGMLPPVSQPSAKQSPRSCTVLGLINC